ncbi:MAG: serine/threonine protein kinase [Deltaproteobacteria bacterium]|nr:serine/threonine protein kinase [Deltaproteobacteria bacterium]
MAAPDPNQRFCPACGAYALAQTCPADGTFTVVLKKFAAGTEIRPGDVVGERYKIVKPLGEGGYSSVFAAQHVITGQETAIKVLKAAWPGPDEQAVRRFYREARVTAGLAHPNTVRVFDVGQTEAGAFWLAMELLHGPSLEQVLQERANGKPPDRVGPGEVLTQAECIEFAIPVLRSLHEAHGQLLVHRDLKPANIVLAKVAGETIVKVLDFGIAQTRGSTLTTTGMALGTPAYMSPEQCQGLELDGRSDLYSMGIVLWRCVTGDVPFADANPVKLMQAHLSRPLPDIWRRARTPLTQPFVDVLLKALRKDKDARYQQPNDMRDALEAASGEMSRTAMDMQAFRLDGKAPPARNRPRNSPSRPLQAVDRPRSDLQPLVRPAKVQLEITVPNPPPSSAPVAAAPPQAAKPPAASVETPLSPARPVRLRPRPPVEPEWPPSDDSLRLSRAPAPGPAEPPGPRPVSQPVRLPDRPGLRLGLALEQEDPGLIRKVTLASAPLRADKVADGDTDRHKALHISPVREPATAAPKPKKVWRKTIPMRGGNVVSGLPSANEPGDTEPM